MRIVFVRHAAAVDQAPGLDDKARMLTAKGEKRLAKDLPQLRERLGESEKPLIWASDALRSLQTAALISQALAADPPAVHPFIYTGEFELLEEAVARLPDEALVVIVGHEPWLSAWAERLSGQPFQFRKGGMAGFERQDIAPLRAAYRWSYRAGAPEVGETDSAQQAAELAPWRKAILAALDSLEKWRNALLKDPERTRPPHQLRVSTRRARSLLSFLKPLLDETSYTAHQDLLREVMGQLSLMRELDVLNLERKAYTREGGKRLRELGRAIKAERGAKQAEALAYLKSDQCTEQLAALREAISAWDRIDLSQAELETFDAARLDDWRRKIQEAWLALDKEDMEAIHALRLRLKKYNNVLNLSHLEAANEENSLPDLKPLQAHLGAVCDMDAHVHLVEVLRQARPDGALDRDAALFTAHLEAWEQQLMSRLEADLAGRSLA